MLHHMLVVALGRGLEETTAGEGNNLGHLLQGRLRGDDALELVALRGLLPGESVGGQPRL